MTTLVSLLPRKAVSDMLGLPRSTLYRDVSRGMLTPPVKLGKSSRWPSNEIEAVVAARIAEASDDEVKALVRQLVEARAQTQSKFQGARKLGAPAPVEDDLLIDW
jgi:prophage regulatory protein